MCRLTFIFTKPIFFWVTFSCTSFSDVISSDVTFVFLTASWPVHPFFLFIIYQSLPSLPSLYSFRLHPPLSHLGFFIGRPRFHSHCIHNQTRRTRLSTTVGHNWFLGPPYVTFISYSSTLVSSKEILICLPLTIHIISPSLPSYFSDSSQLTIFDYRLKPDCSVARQLSHSVPNAVSLTCVFLYIVRPTTVT